MQTIHCTSDMHWIPQRIGNHRLFEAYPWNSLILSGTIIPGGSDAPIESADPLKGIYAAVTRKNKEGKPSGGWQGQEIISIENETIKCEVENEGILKSNKSYLNQGSFDLNHSCF